MKEKENETKSARIRKQEETKEADKIKSIYEQNSVTNENFITHDIKNFILQGKIGQGSFGKVYKVKSRNDGQIYAAKLSIDYIYEKTIKDIKI